MPVPASVDTSQFNAMCGELARLTPQTSGENVLRFEMSRVFDSAAKLTPVAKAANIRAAAKKRTTVRYNGKRYSLANHYSDSLYEQLQAAIKQDLKARLKARGLARKSWWLVGQQSRATFAAPAFVRNALASTGVEYPQNVRVKVTGTAASTLIEIANSQPTVLALPGGRRAFTTALANRRKFFQKNVGAGVFKSAECVAKKYKGFKIT